LDADAAKQGSDDALVVLGSEFQDAFRCFVSVEESMEVCQQDLDLAARLQELGDFDRGHEVGRMWVACGGSFQ